MRLHGTQGILLHFSFWSGAEKVLEPLNYAADVTMFIKSSYIWRLFERTKRCIEIPHQTFFYLMIKELERAERKLSGSQENDEKSSYLSGHMKLEQSK